MKPYEALLPYPHALGSAELLLWTHTCTPLFSPLTSSLLREISSYFPLPALLPASYQHELLIYHLHTGICTVAQRPRRISPRACFCLLDLTTALVFPGHITSTLVLRLNLVSLEIEEMPNMQTPRKTPGTVHYRGEVYVFGGKLNDLALADAEKLTLKRNKWTILPDMLEALANPLPCLHKANIYLLSAQDQGEIQVFSISEQSFSWMQVASSIWNTLVAFSTVDNAVYRLGEKGDFGIWKVDGERRVFERVAGQGEVEGSTCAPVQRSSKVYFLSKQRAVCFEVHLRELELKARVIR